MAKTEKLGIIKSNSHTDETNMPIKQNAQLNTAITPVLEKVQRAIRETHNRHLDAGEIIAPGYAISGSTAISAILERFDRDLEHRKIPPALLEVCVQRHANEPYDRGQHFYILEETANKIPVIATRMIGLAPDIHPDIYWRDNLSHKAIISTAIYYIAHLLDQN